MSGTLKKIIFAVIGIVVIAFLVFMFYGSTIVKGAVEKYGPEMTGTTVALSDVSFSPLSGQAGLTGLVIGSPEGFEAEKVFSLGSVDVSLEPSTILSDPVHIKEIRITDPEIIVEFQGTKLNVNAVMDNIENYTGTTQDESTTNVVIDDLYITGGKVSIMGLPVEEGNQDLTLPEIHLQNIGNQTGNEEGTTFGEATEKTMAAVTAAVTTVVADARVQGFLEKGKDKIKSKIKGLFGGDDDTEDDGGGN